jgi:hypothetical protein
MAVPATVLELNLVWFDLIATDPDLWTGQNLFEHIDARLSVHHVDVSTFPGTISVQNLKKQRSLYNKAPFREKMRISCTRYRNRVKCDKSVNLFDHFYPPQVAIPEPPRVDPLLKSKRKIDALQKKLRRFKAKWDV